MEVSPATIREFVEADRFAVKALYLHCRVNTFSWLNTRMFKLNDFEKDTVGERIFVAEVGGVIVGFVAFSMADTFVHHLYVHQAFAKRGIGKALLNIVLQASPKPFSLKCLEMNQNACDFYTAQGWQIKRRSIGDQGPYFLFVSR
ncbi:GNAT family N-acetyltransferase [Mucilaginibacter terrenus]|uniref:GNAT family N-acetyltransferase n=1 Tax=Mucilaginibacter terrenus TaxID=2482727 RepID=A0A3E2NMI9_9SPHI|nr:GNAT family N-acetyltransferase [Mucilaginibacter terrenus]RFZ82217.1 GNAT family N-acetyltransferase [Mucilaginibacter terrenus]